MLKIEIGKRYLRTDNGIIAKLETIIDLSNYPFIEGKKKLIGILI